MTPAAGPASPNNDGEGGGVSVDANVPITQCKKRKEKRKTSLLPLLVNVLLSKS